MDADGKIVRYFNDVPKVFQYLKEKHIRIGITSLTAEPTDAYDLLETLGWTEYIAFVEMTERDKRLQIMK